jgi:hypothetical protein
MVSLVNGQCAHRWRAMGRCLNLAITTRPITMGDGVTYEIPLCPDHADYFDLRPTPVPRG